MPAPRALPLAMCCLGLSCCVCACLRGLIRRGECSAVPAAAFSAVPETDWPMVPAVPFMWRKMASSSKIGFSSSLPKDTPDSPPKAESVDSPPKPESPDSPPKSWTPKIERQRLKPKRRLHPHMHHGPTGFSMPLCPLNTPSRKPSSAPKKPPKPALHAEETLFWSDSDDGYDHGSPPPKRSVLRRYVSSDSDSDLTSGSNKENAAPDTEEFLNTALVAVKRPGLASSMSQWQQIQLLESKYLDQVHCLYLDNSLPMEVRQYLSYWIEKQDWRYAAHSDPSQAACLFQTMQSLLDEQLGRLVLSEEDNSNIVLKHNLHRSKLQLQDMYRDHPERLAGVIDGLLTQEREILLAAAAASQVAVEPPGDASLVSSHTHNVEERLAEMRRTVQDLRTSIDQLELLQDTLDFRLKTLMILERTTSVEGLLSQKRGELQVLLNNLNVCRKDVLARIQELLGRSDTLRGLLLEERDAWKDRQRRACIGDTCDTSLRPLETWFTTHAEDLFHLLQFLHTMKELLQKLTYDGDPFVVQLPQLEKRLQEQIAVLLKSAFVVESQPCMPFPNRRPLVLKTSQRFSVRARLLVKLLDRNHSGKVKIEIDRDAADLARFRRFNILASNTKTLTMEKHQGQELVCDFKHITLKEQKSCGAGKGKGGKGINEGPVSVLEELHIITLTLDYCYQGFECQLQTSTLPVVIVSNTNQVSSAWASILWFIMLSKDPTNQLFFSNPPTANWAQLSTVLSWQFATATERGLNPEQLKMLGEKLHGSLVEPQSTITWSQFSKEPTTANVSFWAWIDGIILLIQDHLLQLWKKGLIMGFVSRKRERHLLKRSLGGTFLLRFSESIPNGGITCTWVDYDNQGSPEINSVEPYTKDALKFLSLPDIIRHYNILEEANIPENPLHYLYPDIPRDEAFGPYYSERQEDVSVHRKYLNRRLIRVSHPGQPEAAPVPEVPAPEIHTPEVQVPEQPVELQPLEVNGLLPDDDTILPSYVQDLEQGFGRGLLFEQQDPFLSPPGEDHVPEELQELKQLNLSEEDFLL